jgi:hypothetical protein
MNECEKVVNGMVLVVRYATQNNNTWRIQNDIFVVGVAMEFK